MSTSVLALASPVLVVGPEAALDRPVAGTQNDSKADLSIGSDGDRFLLVWSGNRYTLTYASQNIYGSLIEANGQLHKPEIFAIGPIPGYQTHPRISWNGSNYLVMWRGLGSDASVCGARLDRDGNLLGPPSACLSMTDFDGFGSLALAWNGSNHLLAWRDSRRLMAARIGSGGDVLDPNGVLVFDPDTNSLTDISVASDGRDFLIAWTHNARDIYGARVSGDGKVLDTSPLLLCADGTSSQSIPSVAWGKDSYLVSWNDGRNDGDIFGTRVDSAGKILDGACGKPLLIQTGNQGFDTLTWNGQSFLMTWRDAQPIPGQSSVAILRGTTLDPTGTALDLAGKAILNPAPATDPVVGWNGTSYYTLWGTPRTDGSYNIDLSGSRLDSNLNLLDRPAQPLAVGAWQETVPAIASNGNGYLVAWQDRRFDDSDIVAVRLDATGASLDQDAIVLQKMMGRQEEVTVTWDGAAWVVAWLSPYSILVNQGEGFIQYARISPEGALLDPGVVELPNFSASFPTLAHPSSAAWSLLIAAGGPFNAARGIRAFRIDHSGKLMDAAPADIALPPVTEGVAMPKAACRDSECLVVWHFANPSTITADIKGVRVGVDGKPLDQPLVITNSVQDQIEPHVAWDGSHYLVAWSDYRSTTDYDLYGALVGPDGKLVNAQDLLLVKGPQLADATQFSLTWTGLYHLLAWERRTNQQTGSDICGIRIGQDGVPIDGAPVLLAATRFDDQTPVLAAHPAGDGRALLAYSRFDDTPGVVVSRIKVRTLGGGPASQDAGPPDARIADAAAADAGPETAREAPPPPVDVGQEASAADAQPEVDTQPDQRSDQPAAEVFPASDAWTAATDTAASLDSAPPDARPDRAPNDTATTPSPDSRPGDASAQPKASPASSGCSCQLGGTGADPSGIAAFLLLSLLVGAKMRVRRAVAHECGPRR